MTPHEKLEQEFAQWAGVQNVVVCSSGTAALHLAMEAMELPQGSEIIMSDFTMIACPRAAVMAGLNPTFVDCNRDDLLISPYMVGQALANTPYHIKPSAVMFVHIYGRQCVVPDKMYSRYGVRCIEDLAEAHGVRPHPDTDAATWSFYKNKILAGEEGGAVAFKNPAHAVRARMLRSLGFTAEHDFQHIPRGHNYRLADGLATIIRAKLRYVDEKIKQRQQIVALYNKHCPDKWRMPSRQANWVYDIRISHMNPYQQNQIVRALNDTGIPARHAFKPMSYQAEFKDCLLVRSSDNQHEALKASHEVLYLPIVPGVTTEGVISKSFKIINDVLEHSSNNV